MASLLSLFPASQRPTSKRKDVIKSSLDMNEPFGLTIALASVHAGAGFMARHTQLTVRGEVKGSVNSASEATIAFM